MPIYEFKCLECGEQFEFIKLKSDDVVFCPECHVTGERHLEQQISTGTSFTLKGYGWARDGYNKGPYEKKRK